VNIAKLPELLRKDLTGVNAVSRTTTAPETARRFCP